MAKNFEKYLKSRAGMTLAMISLFFGIMLRPGDEAVWNRAEMEMGRAKECVLAKYENLRFVYRLALQIKELHAREAELEGQQSIRRTKLNRELGPNNSVVRCGGSLAGL
jgi:hypothetical protein